MGEYRSVCYVIQSLFRSRIVLHLPLIGENLGSSTGKNQRFHRYLFDSPVDPITMFGLMQSLEFNFQRL